MPIFVQSLLETYNSA